MQVNHSWMKIRYHAISYDMRYATWFLRVEDLWPCEVGGPQRMILKPLEGQQEFTGHSNKNLIKGKVVATRECGLELK
jgi:hypothetical protein